MSLHTFYLDVAVTILDGDEHVPFNKKQIDDAMKELTDIVHSLRALQGRNQLMCSHPKAERESEYSQYDDGYTWCKRCGSEL